MRRRRLVILVLAAFGLGFAANPPVLARPAQTEVALDELFGGFQLSARANGLQLTYDSPGLLPTGSPIFQLSVPEALATLNTGPVGYALASFAFPGPLVADLGAALEQGGTSTGIPPYPVRAEAFYPSGPAAASQGAPGTEMTALADYADSVAIGSYAGLGDGVVVDVGSVRSVSQSVVEGDQVVTRTRVEVGDISILAGLIRIESVVTDLVGASNAETATSAGGTTVSGVTVLGLAAEFVDGELRFRDAPPSDDSPLPVPGPLGAAVDGLTDAVGPLNDLLDQIGAGGDDALQTLFEQSGIRIRLFDAIETADGGFVERTANGLLVEINYDGANTPVLTDLLGLVPSENLPAGNLGPVPFSPQALFNLSKETHIVGVALAPANVAAAATPAFVFPDIDVPLPSSPDSTPLPTTAPLDLAPPSGFATPTPDLPPPPAPRSVTVPVGSERDLPFGDAVPVLAVLAALGCAPFFAAGSRRLADASLTATATACPDGADGPPPLEGPPP